MPVKVLLTMGGTREHIDAARFITNMSTGETGRKIAEELAARSCETVCLCASGSRPPEGANITAKKFTTFRDLDAGLMKLLKTRHFDAVVHLAAVSDYSPALIEAGGRMFRPGRRAKLDSGAPELKLTLKRNFKIIDRIKAYAAGGGRRAPFLIGFKLTSGAAPALVRRKAALLTSADLVVHNDLAEMKKRHPFHLYRNGRKFADCEGAAELAGKLHSIIRTEATCS